MMLLGLKQQQNNKQQQNADYIHEYETWVFQTHSDCILHVFSSCKLPFGIPVYKTWKLIFPVVSIGYDVLHEHT